MPQRAWDAAVEGENRARVGVERQGEVEAKGGHCGNNNVACAHWAPPTLKPALTVDIAQL